jgi:hypothetical protein
VAFAKLYDRKTPITAADLLNDRVGAGASEPLSVGVLVSTYQRPASLKRCLEGIAMQTHRPDDVIVVCWQGDDETRSWLQEREDDGLPVRMVTVMPAGQMFDPQRYRKNCDWRLGASQSKKGWLCRPH